MSRFILARYVLREHIGPFLFAFFVITLIFLLNLLFRELSRILSKGLPWPVVLEFFTLNMAWIIALAVPMAVLTATLMAFGRLSADNEITAMQSSGISINRIIAPAFLASIATAAGLVWFNNEVLPDFNHRTRLLASDIARKRPTINMEPGIWYDDIPNFGLLVQDLVTSGGVTEALNLLIYDYSSSDQIRTISARRGFIELDESKGAMILKLFDGEIQEMDIRKPEEFRRLEFPRQVISIGVDDMFLRRSESEYRGDREKSAAQMRTEVAMHRKEILERHTSMNGSVARSLKPELRELFSPIVDSTVALPQRADPFAATQPGNSRLALPFSQSLRPPPASVRFGSNDNGSVNQLDRLLQSQRRVLEQLEREASMIHSFKRKSNSLKVEIQKKYSIPFACIVFVLIGAPLGVMARRGGIATGGGLSLVFFLVYWASLVGGEDLADRQMISPFLAMWSANAIVGVAGIYLLLRAAQHRATLSLSDALASIRALFPGGNRMKPRDTR